MSNTHNKYIKHIEESLQKVAPEKSKEQLIKMASYIGTKNKLLGIDTPLQREMAKSTYGLLDNKDWPYVLNAVFKGSAVFEVKNAALYITDKHYKKNKAIFYELLPDWINYTDNWAHSDYLSKFYTGFLEDEAIKKDFLKKIQHWNNDANFWKRRQSLVSLYFYARSKKQFLPYAVTEKLIHNLLTDKEYFVQKGLGWALRESYNVYPKETLNYISKNVNNISSTAFSAATEKMSIKQKEVLKDQRKKLRIKN